MTHEVKLNQLTEKLEDLSYPVTREQAITEFDDVVLRYADGEERLSDVISRSTAEVYHDLDDLETEIYNQLPTEAVGEPGQSEGEG